MSCFKTKSVEVYDQYRYSCLWLCPEAVCQLKIHMELKDWTCAVMESLKVMFTFFHWTKGTFAENVATSVTVQVRLLWWHFRSKNPVEAYFVYSTSWKHAWSFQGFERWSNYETSLIFESHTHTSSDQRSNNVGWTSSTCQQPVVF